jgi:hypothetical protein
MPLGDLMQAEARDLPWGTTAIIVTAVSDTPLTLGVNRLLEAGHGAVALLVGDLVPPLTVSVPSYRVTTARAWQALEGLDPTMVDRGSSIVVRG